MEDMNKIREYVREKSELLEDKKAGLDAMLQRYETLMASDDSELRIKCSNEIVLANDGVYTSCNADESLKNAIRTRKLNGMKPEDFEDSYKQAQYGIASREIVPAEDSETGIVLAGENLDIVPAVIDAQTAIMAGHTDRYLLGKCREYNITRGQLDDMISIKSKYSTDFPTMLKLLERGYSTDAMDEILEARERFVLDESVPSVKRMVEFMECFQLPADAEELEESIRSVCVEGMKYVDKSMRNAVRIAGEIEFANLETVVDYLTGELRSVSDNDDFEDESSP